MNSDVTALTVRGRAIREDEHGRLSLDDIWSAANAKEGQRPKKWRTLPRAGRLVIALERKVRKSDLLLKKPFIPVISSKIGRGSQGTFAHPILAVAYAGHLNSDLEVEVLNIWLRYRSGDATLADEILERASDEANRWVVARALGRIQRRKYTDVFQYRGVRSFGFARCTNAIYKGLWSKTAFQIQSERNVKVTRDGLEVIELAQVTLSEGMASDRIAEEQCWGDAECAEASEISASFVREAMERERASRRVKRLGV